MDVGCGAEDGAGRQGGWGGRWWQDERTHLVEARIHFVMAVPRASIFAVPCHVRAVLQGLERTVVAGGDRDRKESGVWKCVCVCV